MKRLGRIEAESRLCKIDIALNSSENVIANDASITEIEDYFSFNLERFVSKLFIFRRKER